MVKAKESLSLLDIMEFKFFKLRKSNEKQQIYVCIFHISNDMCFL